MRRHSQAQKINCLLDWVEWIKWECMTFKFHRHCFFLKNFVCEWVWVCVCIHLTWSPIAHQYMYNKYILSCSLENSNEVWEKNRHAYTNCFLLFLVEIENENKPFQCFARNKLGDKIYIKCISSNIKSKKGTYKMNYYEVGMRIRNVAVTATATAKQRMIIFFSICCMTSSYDISN